MANEANDAASARRRLRISCADALELLTELLEEALGPADRERLEQHLDGCQACAAYLDQLRATVTMVGSIRGDDEYQVDEGTMDALIEVFRSRTEGLPEL